MYSSVWDPPSDSSRLGYACSGSRLIQWPLLLCRNAQGERLPPEALIFWHEDGLSLALYYTTTLLCTVSTLPIAVPCLPDDVGGRLPACLIHVQQSTKLILLFSLPVTVRLFYL